MEIRDDILNLLVGEGYKITEIITDALDEFLTVVTEEGEMAEFPDDMDMDDDLDDE